MKKRLSPLLIGACLFFACQTDPPAAEAVVTPPEVNELSGKRSGSRQDAVTDVAGVDVEVDTPNATKTDAMDAQATTNRTVSMTAEFTYAADAAVFKRCDNGVRYNLLQNSGYQALEKAYLAAKPDAFQPIYVRVSGFEAPHLVLDEENGRPTMVVLGVVETDKFKRCD